MATLTRRAIIGLVLIASVGGLQATAAVASGRSGCPPSGRETAYDLSLQALTGPRGADLALAVTPADGSDCVQPDALENVLVKVYGLDGRVKSIRDLRDVHAPGGKADIDLGAVGRGQRVTAMVLVHPVPSRIDVLRDATTTLLRPDLVVNASTSPRVVFATRAFTVDAVVAELNGDVGATATAVLTDGSTTLASTQVTVEAGGTTNVEFPGVALTEPGGSDLRLALVDPAPAETDATNDERTAPIDVINFADDHEHVLTSPLGGYGAQMNQNVYAAITGAPPAVLGNLESLVVAQQPGIVRVFFNDVQARSFPDRLTSFYKTLQLAQHAGATINVTLQSTAGLTLSLAVTRFADALNTAVRTYGVTNLRWVTIQNEPNSTALTPAQLEPWYRALDTKLRALGLRDQIRFMGLDLVATDQQSWFDYAAAHMSDLLDAYSIHVFWDYWDTAKLEQRLQDVRAIVDALPADAQKPLYSMEYGVRGIRQIGTTTFTDPGVWDATQQIPLTQTNVNAFQQAWFDVESAALGYAGTVKWDSYFGKYDNGSQAYFMIGQWDDGGIWPTYPVYNVVRLLTAATHPAWNVTSVEDDSIFDSRLAASYAGPGGELTVVGLDRQGGQLNDASATVVPYAIGGLPPSTTFRLLEWNRDGDGRNADAGTVTTDSAGVAQFGVPQQGMFALTNSSFAGSF
jgi:hypothetical protein